MHLFLPIIGDIFEGGTRVPLVVSWKNKFWKGVKRDHYVSLSDIYATLCELVGVGVPNDSAQDSVSFAKYLYAKKNTDGLRKFLSTVRIITCIEYTYFNIFC